MGQLELSQTAQQWVNVVLIWLGFGIVAGLLARALVPGKHPVGAVATLLIGVLGSTIGLLALSFLLPGDRLNPIGPVGLLAATGGALVLLIGYRLVVACFVFDSRDPHPRNPADGPP